LLRKRISYFRIVPGKGERVRKGVRAPCLE
jgi:hypothetical protein